MRFLFFWILLSTCIFGYAQTDEIDLEEDIEEHYPVKRSSRPNLKVTITDLTWINVEAPAIDSEVEIEVLETSTSSIIMNKIGFGPFYFPGTLLEGETYTIVISVDHHRYSGLYQP